MLSLPTNAAIVSTEVSIGMEITYNSGFNFVITRSCRLCKVHTDYIKSGGENMKKCLFFLCVAVFVYSIAPTNICIASLIDDEVTIDIWSCSYSNPPYLYYSILEPTQYVVGSGLEYYEQSDSLQPVFTIERSVDIASNTISIENNVYYGGTGGGNVYPILVRVSDIDWLGESSGSVINDYQIVSQTGESEVIDFGSDYIDLWLGGGYNPYSFEHSISVELIPSAVPIPGAGWLFVSGALGFAGYRRKLKS
jgi:hypothetical protein